MKTIVIASGKGGTGKTTITALFAMLAARDSRVVVADADVEGSNLPLALGAADETCEVFEGMRRAVVDEQVCTSCGACEVACRFGAIRTHGDSASVDALSCEGCAVCSRICPGGAISMEARIAGSACEGTSKVGPIAFGQLEPAEDLSGRLVTAVRVKAAAAGERGEADYVLVDGPPGVGCPVIAAVADADLLVAVAEPTISGAHDLARLLELARRFRLPSVALLNKADLSSEGAERIRRLCAAEGVALVAEIPFDRGLANLLPAAASSAPSSAAMATDAGEGRRILSEAWLAIAARAGLGS